VVDGDVSCAAAVTKASDQACCPVVQGGAVGLFRQAFVDVAPNHLGDRYAALARFGRLGLEALTSFRTDFAPLLEIVWVDDALHNAGLDRLLERRKRPLSLVDAVSVAAMRQRGVDEAFAFDPHFEAEGFSVVA
jgi:predicted nucleic acid-binding protein